MSHNSYFWARRAFRAWNAYGNLLNDDSATYANDFEKRSLNPCRLRERATVFRGHESLATGML